MKRSLVAFYKSNSNVEIFLKRLGIIITALLLGIGIIYSEKWVFLTSLIVSIIIGYLSILRNNILINGALFGYFFILCIMLINFKGNIDIPSIIKIITMPLIGAILGIFGSVLGHSIKQKLFIWLLLISILAAGLPIWFTSYTNYMNKGEIGFSLLLTILLAVIFTLRTKLQIHTIYFAITLGFIIAIFIKVTIDGQTDPTSHNLLPFEILIDGCSAFGASLIGIAIGSAFQKYKGKHTQQQ